MQHITVNRAKKATHYLSSSSFYFACHQPRYRKPASQDEKVLQSAEGITLARE